MSKDGSKACVLSLLLLLYSGVFSKPAAAQTSEPVNETPANFHWQVFVDTYYAWDFQRPRDQNRLYTTQPLRHNELGLNLGLLHAAYENANLRGQLGFQTGTYVESNLAAEPALFQGLYAASAGVKLHDALWLDVGVFPSHIGFEAIVSADNWTYSRSLIADYSPYYESGLKLSANHGEWQGALLVLNGWQNIRDNNHDKAIGTQLQWKPIEQIQLNWSSFAGNEAPLEKATQWRVFNNFFAVYRPFDTWEIMAGLDYGLQQKLPAEGWSQWLGTVLQSRWHLSPEWRLAGRIESFSDPDQVLINTNTPQGFQVGGASLNVDYAFHPLALWRIEGRVFLSRDAIYPGAEKDQFSAVNVSLVSSLSLRFGQP